ncbi:MAG: amino acid permease [Erysipelotrichaceae bacterium]|nr:amino acid permease [Erysipelotrichaceae bacterium]
MSTQSQNRLQPYLSPAGAWAVALGTSIGWGSLVVTANSYLLKAGPSGSMLGIIAGAFIMLVISRNYHFLMVIFPDAGGSYAYSREVFGYDHGFLNSWFLILTYLAMLWANAASLPVFAGYLAGDIFRFGNMYTFSGYDVYFGEFLISAAAVVISTLLCMHLKKLTGKLMTVMAAVMVLAVSVCFISSASHGIAARPSFIPGKAPLLQVLQIAAISPWAFVGFENISHAAEEFSFPLRKTFGILCAAVVSSALLYLMVILLSVSASPSGYADWLAYLSDYGTLEGVRAIPAFFAANHFLGNTGTAVMMSALLCMIMTSLIGNTLALSRLFYAMAKDGILPEKYADLKDGTPYRALMLVGLTSVLIPLLGRTAIGWIVDVTTIGAVIIYGYVSACTITVASRQNDHTEKATGILGLGFMILIGGYLLIPNLFGSGSMETESYFLFAVWALLGFIVFRRILRKDTERKFGNSIVVWIGLLFLILFISQVWMSRNTMDATASAMSSLREFYAASGVYEGEAGMIEAQMDMIRRTNARSLIMVIGMFALSLSVLLNNYAIMRRRAQESEIQLGQMKNIANTDPLTGVKSKHAYSEKEREIDKLIACGEAGSFAVAVCDVNGLKYINDTYGHKAGDEYIKKAAMMICRIFKHSPVYRMGGDEFVVFLSGEDYEKREALISGLRSISEEHIQSGEVVVAAGYSDYESPKDAGVKAVFERADRKMYECKQELKFRGARTR